LGRAGWQTTNVDLAHSTVTFRRVATSLPKQQREGHDVRSWVTAASETSDRHPHTWDSTNRVDIRAQFEWRPIGHVALDQERRLVFPKAPSSPGLYRFRLLKGGREAWYIGETDNISRRFAHYRNPGPGQETNLRLNARFFQALIDAAEISVAIVNDGAQIDLGKGFGPVDLESKSIRRLLENAALVECGGIDIEMLNRGK